MQPTAALDAVQATPRNTASDRVTDSMASALRRPNGWPILSRFTVMALSTITCDGLRRPFSGAGNTVGRISGVSTRVPYSSSTVTVPV